MSESKYEESDDKLDTYEHEKATGAGEDVALEEEEIENSPIEAVRLG